VVGVLKEHRIHQLELCLQAGAKWTENNLVISICTATFSTRHAFICCFIKCLHRQAWLISVFKIYPIVRRQCAEYGSECQSGQEILGHSRISMTLNTYSDVLPGMQEEAVEKTSNLFQTS